MRLSNCTWPGRTHVFCARNRLFVVFYLPLNPRLYKRLLEAMAAPLSTLASERIEQWNIQPHNIAKSAR